MENNVHIILPEKKKFIKKEPKSFSSIKILGPFLFLILNAIFLFSFDLELRYFFTLLAILSIFTTILCVLLPRDALSKLEKVVFKIILKNEQLSIETIKGSVNIPVKEIKFSKNTISIMGADFLAFQFVHDGKSYHIIIDYFEPNFLEEFDTKVS